MPSEEGAETKMAEEDCAQVDEADGPLEQDDLDVEAYASGPEKRGSTDSNKGSRKSRSRTSSGGTLVGKKDVLSAFNKVAGAGAKMDRRLFEKCMKAALFLDKEFTSADVNTIFVKHAGGTAGKLDFAAFTSCLEAAAAKKKLGTDKVNSKALAALLAQVEPKKDSTGSADRAKSAGAAGPARLFYDTSSYTGVHKKGGPKTCDDDSIHKDLSKMVRRSKSTGALKSSEKKGAPERPAEPLHVPNVGQQGPERFFYDKSTYTGTHAKKDDVNSTTLVKKAPAKTNPKKGPERFFYDKSAYTAAAKGARKSQVKGNRGPSAQGESKSGQIVNGGSVL